MSKTLRLSVEKMVKEKDVDGLIEFIEAYADEAEIIAEVDVTPQKNKSIEQQVEEIVEKHVCRVTAHGVLKTIRLHETSLERMKGELKQALQERDRIAREETNKEFEPMVKKTHDIATQNGYALAIKHFEERMAKGQSVFDALESMKDIHRKRQALTKDNK